MVSLVKSRILYRLSPPPPTWSLHGGGRHARRRRLQLAVEAHASTALTAPRLFCTISPCLHALRASIPSSSASNQTAPAHQPPNAHTPSPQVPPLTINAIAIIVTAANRTPCCFVIASGSIRLQVANFNFQPYLCTSPCIHAAADASSQRSNAYPPSSSLNPPPQLHHFPFLRVSPPATSHTLTPLNPLPCARLC